jgi:hypothetical protein
MTLPSCTKGPVWESEEGRALSGFRLGLALVRLSHLHTKVKGLAFGRRLGLALYTREGVRAGEEERRPRRAPLVREAGEVEDGWSSIALGPTVASDLDRENLRAPSAGRGRTRPSRFGGIRREDK